jgi:sensor histidine kinase regulating citrate/malate metabolism
MKQNLEKVKDHNIGIGLACSKSIVNSLNGEIKINKSINGFTSFSFMFPVNTQTFSGNPYNLE